MSDDIIVAQTDAGGKFPGVSTYQLREEARERYDEIRRREQAPRLEMIQGLVGKYFRQTVSYQAGGEEFSRWCEVTGLSGPNILYDQFEIDNYGAVRIEPNRMQDKDWAWQEVPRKEFDLAWKVMLKSVKEMR